VAVMWWPVAVIGIVALIGCFALAALLPSAPGRRRLRPLANTGRLTRLPEYARAARLQSASTIAVLALLVVLFGAAVLTAARPQGPDPGFAAAHPEDVMLCVGQPASEPTTAALLRYFAGPAATPESGARIGLTSANRRVVPLTRDHQYAGTRFSAIASGDTAADDTFAPQVPYTDYTPSVADVLALCLTGFPGFEATSTHRRSVKYLGPPAYPQDQGGRSLFTDQQVTDMAVRAGVQVNAITAPDAEELGAVVARTGGQLADQADLADGVQRIRRAPPPLVMPDGTTVTGASVDTPDAALAVGVVTTALLTVALVVLRR